MAQSSYNNIENQLKALAGRGPNQKAKRGWGNLELDENGVYIIPPGVSLNNLSELSHMLLTEFNLGHLIPSDLFSNKVRIASLTLTKGSVQAHTSTTLRFMLAWDVVWDLDILKIGAPQIEIVYSQGYAEGTLRGLLSLGTTDAAITLATSVDFPSGTVVATLTHAELIKKVKNKVLTKPAATIFKHFNAPALPQPHGGATGPHLTVFKLLANVRDKIFVTHVGVSNIMLRKTKVAGKEIVLEITDLQGELHYRGGAQGYITGQLWATLLIGQKNNPISLSVLAAKQRSGWFFGGALSGIGGRAITLKAMVDDLTGLFGVSAAAPSELDALSLVGLSVSFDTATKDFSFHLDAKFPKDGAADLKFMVDFTHTGNDAYTHNFSGSLTIAKQEFDIVFSQQTANEQTQNYFIADYQNLGGPQLKLGTLLKELTKDTTVTLLANKIDIDLKAALLAYVGTQGSKKSHVILTADLGFGVDLSNLPLVNRLFPSANALGVQFQPVLATNNDTEERKKNPIDAKTVDALNALVPNGAISLPNKVRSADDPGGLEGTFQLIAKLKIGDQVVDLTQSLGGAAKDLHSSYKSNTPVVAVQENTEIETTFSVVEQLDDEIDTKLQGKGDDESELIDAVDFESQINELSTQLELLGLRQLDQADYEQEAENLKLQIEEIEKKAASAPDPQPAIDIDEKIEGEIVAPAPPGTAGQAAQPPTTTGEATWYEVQKTLGPVHFQRVGIRFDSVQKEIWFLLDASLSAIGLSLELNGLGAGIKLADIKNRKFDPDFTLHGVGLDFKEGPVEIGGEFLHNKIKPPHAKTSIDSYDGMLRVQFEELTLAAIGSYSRFQGHHSVFVYLTVDYPLGGPAFFFVNGLAGGFGYNRDLKMPTIDGVIDFPLVAEAISPSAPALESGGQSRFDRLNTEITKLQDFVPPRIGQYFLAAGLRYTSFELFDSFTLLAVAFGKRLEIDLLGVTSAVLPTPEGGSSMPRLAEVQIALKATFVPDEGILTVRAQLTRNSYIFSRKCLLTGGLAFYAWFKDQTSGAAAGANAGDFVFTIGGYHKKFQPPAYYPRAPQLGFSWQVSDIVSVKGNAYFALTPNAMMAGGHLEALWKSGSLSAWFKAGADFLLGWKPFHYDGEIYVSIGASLTFHFFGTHHVTVELGGDLHLWGPEFSGKVKIHYYIVSATVSFGSAKPEAKPLTWPQFRDSFLPKGKAAATSNNMPDEIISVAVNRGLVSTVAEANKLETWIINPKEFSLTVDSPIPVTHTDNFTPKQPDSDPIPDDPAYKIGVTHFGIAPMGLNDVTSTMTIDVKKGNSSAESSFRFKPVKKSMPAAMWGDHFAPNMNGTRTVDDLCTGFIITPAKPPKALGTQPIDKSKLQYEDANAPTHGALKEAKPVPKSLEATPLPHAGQSARQAVAATQSSINNSIMSKTVVEQRNNLLHALGFRDPMSEIDLDTHLADSLIVAEKQTPQKGRNSS